MDYLQPLIDNLKAASNPQKAKWMQDYLKGLFPLYGIETKKRSEILKYFFKTYGLPDRSKLFDVTDALWELPERDFQYCAITLLQKYQDKLDISDIQYIEKYITQKSWWDSVDGLAATICGEYFKIYPEQRIPVTSKWINSGNMWLQRSALLFQLKYKKDTDTNLLSSYINQLSDSKEFFIRKAIGWILREYSKTNPDWVRKLLKTAILSGLSRREAAKYLM